MPCFLSINILNSEMVIVTSINERAGSEVFSGQNRTDRRCGGSRNKTSMRQLDFPSQQTDSSYIQESSQFFQTLLRRDEL